MSDPKPTASLSPTLLARKGGAKPAMRPQIQPLQQFHEATAREMSEDLGWNDLGETESEHRPEGDHEASSGEVISINGGEAISIGEPEIVHQQQELVQSLSVPADRRKSALKCGRRAAFTLRIDAERHLRLRLASTISNQSAQRIVTEALDQFLDTMPEIESLAAKVRKNH